MLPPFIVYRLFQDNTLNVANDKDISNDAD